MRPEVLDAYGHFIAELAPWTWFVTLTFDPRELAAISSTYTRVGLQRARKRLVRWIHDDVARACPDAKAYFETELHVSGQPHHHGILALGPNAPHLTLRTAWYSTNGWARFDAIREGRGAVARYVAKYSTKASTGAPFTMGLGAGITRVIRHTPSILRPYADLREVRWHRDPALLIT